MRRGGESPDWLGEYGYMAGDGGGDFDALTGAKLDPKLVAEGIEEEMGCMRKQDVWTPVKRAQVLQSNPRAQIIKTGWVKNNKGNAVRCRLVGKEYANEKRDDLFAGTPPLAAMRHLVSSATSMGVRSWKQRIAVVDVKRAFLHGVAEREIYIEIPPEDPHYDGGSTIGRLNKTLYGTRDAPLAWQKIVREFMARQGFTSTVVSPGVYFHPTRLLKVISHVDDFLITGEGHNVSWFVAELEKAYEVKTQILGWGHGELSEITFLGRSIRKSCRGLEVEGDAKHCQQLIKEWCMEGAKPVNTPMVKHERNPEAPAMSSKEATAYRRATARLSYMSQDRADLTFAASALASRMSDPRVGDEVAIKRAIRYLLHRPSCILHYNVQDCPGSIAVYVDSDWANDPVTRRSMSGGVVTRGSHTLHWWSRRQATVALSSCEAELNSLVKGACEARFVSFVCRLFSEPSEIVLHTDSSAAKGVVVRAGSGKLKHLSCNQLWIQEKVACGAIVVEKVPRDHNPSDALTHDWSEGEWRFFKTLGFA